MNPTVGQQKPLILGIGNLLMGDEGVGVAAISYLEKMGLADHAELVDGGTSGFHLLGLFRDRQNIILIDAATDGKPLGTVSLIHPRYANDFPPTLTAHDIGLKDLLESAALLGDLPAVDLITISIDNLALIADAAGVGADLRRAGRNRRSFKILLRNPADLGVTQDRLGERLLRPGDTVSYLRADICRPELLVEVEATFAD